MTYTPITARTSSSARADLTVVAVPPPFDPSSIAGLVTWYDAADLATLTVAAGLVSQWDNKAAASGDDFYQASATNQPASGTRTLNSKNVLDFDGTTDFLLDWPGSTRAQPQTWFVVARADSFPGTEVQLLDYAGTLQMAWKYAGQYAIWGGSAIVGGGTPDTAAHIFTAVFNGASSQGWLDGASIFTGNGGTVSSSGRATIGALNAGTGRPFDGIIGEWIAYTGALSSTDRGNVQSYLKAKWGTP